MISGLSDTQVRVNVRMALTQLRLDVQEISISSARGVVRITGELKRSTPEAPPIRATMLEDFERELRRAKGVRRVHLDPVNWRQMPGGSWAAVQPVGAGSAERVGTSMSHASLNASTNAPRSIPLKAR